MALQMFWIAGHGVHVMSICIDQLLEPTCALQCMSWSSGLQVVLHAINEDAKQASITMLLQSMCCILSFLFLHGYIIFSKFWLTGTST